MGLIVGGGDGGEIGLVGGEFVFVMPPFSTTEATIPKAVDRSIQIRTNPLDAP